MKFHTFVAVTVFSLGTIGVHAETIRLSDGSVIEGQLGAPVEVTIATAAGEKKVAFALLPAEVQKLYVPKIAEAKAMAKAEALVAVAAPLPDEELAALANEVSLPTWQEVASIGSFRDKAEKRGTGGLPVTKAFNALDENWVTVYSPKDPVGLAGNWDAQVARAKSMQARTQQFMQQRWLEAFINAGTAVSKRDSNEFAAHVRELKRNPLTASADTVAERNFFTAK